MNDLRGKGGSAASLRAYEARQLNKKEAGLYPCGPCGHGGIGAEEPAVDKIRVCPRQTSDPLRMTSSSPAKAPRSARAPERAEPVASSYEAALAELEQLVAQLEGGQLPLDQLLTRYQRGAELLAYCRARLDAVENQIKVHENGETKPWDGQ